MRDRIKKINKLIMHHINDIITRDINIKSGVFITIPKVDTSADLRYSRVFVSIYPEKEISYAKKTLEKEIYKIQGILNKQLHMRPLPKIEFRVDMTESKADQIEKLLKEI